MASLTALLGHAARGVSRTCPASGPRHPRPASAGTSSTRSPFARLPITVVSVDAGVRDLDVGDIGCRRRAGSGVRLLDNRIDTLWRDRVQTEAFPGRVSVPKRVLRAGQGLGGRPADAQLDDGRPVGGTGGGGFKGRPPPEFSLINGFTLYWFIDCVSDVINFPHD